MIGFLLFAAAVSVDHPDTWDCMERNPEEAEACAQKLLAASEKQLQMELARMLSLAAKIDAEESLVSQQSQSTHDALKAAQLSWEAFKANNCSFESSLTAERAKAKAAELQCLAGKNYERADVFRFYQIMYSR